MPHHSSWSSGAGSGPRPSAEGFQDGGGEGGFGFGGLGISGFGAGGCGGCAQNVYDPGAVLQSMAVDQASHCPASTPLRGYASARVETTYSEVVDVRVDLHGEPALSYCIEEALWSLD